MTRAEREALHADLDDAERRAEAAELGCEIAYRREPTQAEGDAHEYRHDQSMGASECIGECHVPMGNHHGHRCRCGLWVWGGPTVCVKCVAADAVACVQAQRDIILDASAEGSWMARALDAERERDRLRERVRLAEGHIAHMATLGCRGVACSDARPCASCYAREASRASSAGGTP